MLAVAVGLQPQYSSRVAVPFPTGFALDQGRFGFDVTRSGGWFETDLNPRDLIDPAVWSHPAFHVDRVGNDSSDGVGAQDGDFFNAKRTIHAEFDARNATDASYRVLVNANTFWGSAFARNGQIEPEQPVAVHMRIQGRSPLPACSQNYRCDHLQKKMEQKRADARSRKRFPMRQKKRCSVVN